MEWKKGIATQPLSPEEWIELEKLRKKATTLKQDIQELETFKLEMKEGEAAEGEAAEGEAGDVEGDEE